MPKVPDCAGVTRCEKSSNWQKDSRLTMFGALTPDTKGGRSSGYNVGNGVGRRIWKRETSELGMRNKS